MFIKRLNTPFLIDKGVKYLASRGKRGNLSSQINSQDWAFPPHKRPVFKRQVTKFFGYGLSACKGVYFLGSGYPVRTLYPPIVLHMASVTLRRPCCMTSIARNFRLIDSCGVDIAISMNVYRGVAINTFHASFKMHVFSYM